MFTCFFLVASVLGAGIQLFVQKKPCTRARCIDVLLLWLLVVAVGIQGLLYFAAHAFEPNQTARLIGWPTGSPFQFEVAIANLSFGVLGILCIWIRGNFWYATGIGDIILYLGAAYGHIVQVVRYHDDAPANSGLFLYCEIITALLLGSLLLAHWLIPPPTIMSRDG